jgi:CBS domain containing-hemolysin-like protein
VGALVVELLGRLPRAGDKVDIGVSAQAEVTGISKRRVTRVRVRIKKGKPESAGETEGAPAER